MLVSVMKDEDEGCEELARRIAPFLAILIFFLFFAIDLGLGKTCV